MGIKFIRGAVIILSSIFLCWALVYATDIKNLGEDFDSFKKWSMLQGPIDTLVIDKGNVQIHLGSGDVTLYNFDVQKPSIIFFDGQGRFIYTPPIETEERYLSLVSGLEKIDDVFKNATFIMANEEIAALDTSLFKRDKVKSKDWREVTRFNDDLDEYLGFNPHLRAMGEMLSGEPVSCFLARFKIDEIGDLVYCEDPVCEEYCRIYRYVEKGKHPEILAAYSPNGLLPEQRGFISMDITHYDINAKVNGIGKIESECTVRFKPLRGGSRFTYFDLSGDLEVSSVTDSQGTPIPIFGWDGNPGFGVWWDPPLQINKEYEILVAYDGKPFIYEWEIYFADEQAPWYPANLCPDRSTFNIRLDYPDEDEFAYKGAVMGKDKDKFDGEAQWTIADSVLSVPLYYGPMYASDFMTKDRIKVDMFAPKLHDWISKGDAMDSRRQVIVNALLNVMADFYWFDQSTDDLARDLYVYNRIMNNCPYDTICVVESPFANPIGAAGIAMLSTSLEDNFRIRNRFTRSHELAHLWWGQAVNVTRPSDIWIIEGLAEYFAYLANSDPQGKEYLPDSILIAWRDSILVGSSDGLPMTMGARLANPAVHRYDDLVISKAAYIFHMIRYILYDFNTDSDRIFIRFLQDIIESYSYKPFNLKELTGILERYIGADADWFLDQWVNSLEIPKYVVGYSFPPQTDSTYNLILRVKQENVSPQFKMIVPVKIEMEDFYFVIRKVIIDKPENEINIEGLPHRPIKLEFNIENAVLCEVDYE
ncbi:MAG: hypothetical protein JSU85_02145 [Candidatus Zixiibacteriota bacterium]|nr:MAG: hypothetical protein JSU85_02145 [candidate division Zixibacteria bacterium]